MWAKASEQLYVLCWKIDVEDQRHNTMITGKILMFLLTLMDFILNLM